VKRALDTPHRARPETLPNYSLPLQLLSFQIRFALRVYFRCSQDSQFAAFTPVGPWRGKGEGRVAHACAEVPARCPPSRCPCG
jgi:hypothetical protein